MLALLLVCGVTAAAQPNQRGCEQATARQPQTKEEWLARAREMEAALKREPRNAAAATALGEACSGPATACD